MAGILVESRDAALQVASASPGHSLAQSVGIAQLQAALKSAGPLDVADVASVVVGAADDFELLVRGGLVAERIAGVLVGASGASAG